MVLKKGTDLDTRATAKTYGWIEYDIAWSARTVTIANAVSLAKGDEVYFFNPDGTYKGYAFVSSDTSHSTTFVIDAMSDGSDPVAGDIAATFWHGAGDLAEAITASNTPCTIVADFEDADGIFPSSLVGLINHGNPNPSTGRPPVEYLTVDRCAFTIGQGNVHDDDCSSLTGWTDGDLSGESTQETFQDRDTFKFTIASIGGGHKAERYRNVGTLEDSFTVQIRTYFNDIGTTGDADNFLLIVDNGTIVLSVRFGTDGMFIYDGAAWNEVGTNIVEEDTWTVWRLVVDGSLSGSETVDLYKDDFLIESGIDCSDASGATDGLVTLRQEGTTTSGVTSYIDFLKISDGSPNLTGECFIATETTIQSDYAVKTRAEVQGSESENFNVDGLTLIVQVDRGDSQSVTLSGNGQTAAQVVAQISLTGATTYEYTSGKVAIRSDSYYTTGSIQILSASTADIVLGLSNSIVYGTDGMVASCVLQLGDIEPTVTTPVASGSGIYDHSTYPILTYKKGTLTADVTVTFSNDTNFTVSMVVDGNSTNLGAGDINTDFQIPHQGEYYFTIQSDGWGGTWVAANTLSFSLVQSARGVWAKEVVPAATEASSGNKVEISCRAQS
ncbi:MAG: hypothetical protein JW885_11570 [Deltaproteobacteria bacterium]|nr:hypothetical protein [Candidatus Zymogenaceae bacterium]